jgi:hypothetical protein
MARSSDRSSRCRSSSLPTAAQLAASYLHRSVIQPAVIPAKADDACVMAFAVCPGGTAIASE